MSGTRKQTNNAQESVAPAPAASSAQLLAPFGFIDDAGRNRTWSAGEVVADPVEIGLLIDRGAPVLLS